MTLNGSGLVGLALLFLIPAGQRPGEQTGAQCGAVYVPSWTLAQHAPFTQGQIKACDGELSAVTGEAALRVAVGQIGAAITQNWNAYHGAAAFLPKPGERAGRASREEVAAQQALMLEHRTFLRILERLGQQLTRLSTDGSLTTGQKTVVTERIRKPGPKACVAEDKWVWAGRVDGVVHQVVVPDPVLVETMKNEQAYLAAGVTAFSYETGPQPCVVF